MPRPACPAPSTAPSRRTRTTSSRTRSTSVSLCRTSTSRAPPTCAPPTCRCRVAPGSASLCPRTPSTWASSGVRRPTGLTTSPRRATSCSHSTRGSPLMNQSTERTYARGILKTNEHNLGWLLKRFINVNVVGDLAPTPQSHPSSAATCHKLVNRAKAF